MLETWKRNRAALLASAAVGLLVVSSPTIASDAGFAAAEQVDQESYIEFLDVWLYTHIGDSRGPNGPDLIPARDNIAMLMESYGLDVELEPFSYGSGTYHNVVGTKLGTVHPDQEFIIGSHYDSVSNPGADDNASGTALVLEAARIISQYESDYTIRFVTFSMEEAGLIGSEAYVDAHFADDILGMISADMVAYDTGTDNCNVYGRSASDPIKQAMADAVAEYGSGLGATIGGDTPYSDHAPFEAAGLQACLLIEGLVWSNPFYHTQDDNFENPDNLNFDYAEKMARSVVGWLVDAAGVHVPFEALEFVYPDGRPEFADPSGGTTIRVEVAGVGDTVPEPGTGMLHYKIGDTWQEEPMVVAGENIYDAVLPAASCGETIRYYFSAESTGGETFSDPRTAPDVFFSATAALGEAVYMEDDFETDLGWTVSGDAATGQWERGIPVGGGDRGDPATDYDGSGRCYLTGNFDGDSDIDDGYTYLTSPALDLSTGSALIEYALWYTNNAGSDPNNDLFKIWVSNDGGANYQLVEIVGPMSPSGWNIHTFDVSDFVVPTDQVRVMYEASDLNAGSVVEAGIDAFRVFEYECESVCPEDLNGDDTVSVMDLLMLLDAWGACPDCPEDLNDDGTVNVMDLLMLLEAWGPCG
jgi:hypothetical protein